jgi:6-phosphogluconolactonase
MDSRRNLHIFADRNSLSSALAVHVVDLAAKSIAGRSRFCVALSGGSLMEIVSPPLGSNPLRDSVDWSRWHVFWADERWVPWSSPESNYGLARRLFFSRVNIPANQIHATDDSLTPSATAQAYESCLANVFQPGAGRLPRFDLILLGVGKDGHTASLFPDHPSLNENRRWVIPVSNAPKPPPIRITMSLPLINHARHVVFVAAGPGKTNIVSQLLDPEAKPAALPARRVNPSDGELQWFVDRAASAGVRS